MASIRQEISAEYIQQLFAKTPMPRNQVASISGLSNTYIRDLERGMIANVAREKLISLAVALNLDLLETEHMLNVFDRAPLSTDDIPIFLQTAQVGCITSALLPVRDRYSLDLMMLSAERIPGDQVLVSSEPTVCLRAEGHRSYSERELAKTHTIYSELVEAIGRERRATIEANLASHTMEHYICAMCLEDYIENCKDPVEKDWRIRHIDNVIYFVERFPNWHFRLVETCPTFSFVIKMPEPLTGEKDKILITRLAPHRFQEKRTGKLTGFTTDNQVVIQNFKDEVEGIKRRVISQYQDRGELVSYLQRICTL